MSSHEQQALRARVDDVRGRLDSLTADLGTLDAEVEGLAPHRSRYELLDRACGSLQELEELGAAPLFWGDELDSARIDRQLSEARDRVSAFQAQLDDLDARRGTILEDIERENQCLESLGEEIYYIQEQEELRQLEWVIEREISDVTRRQQLMAWARGGEEDRRFRRTLTAMLMSSLPLAALLSMIDLPLPERFAPEDMPRRIVKLVREEKPKPTLPPPVLAENKPEPKEVDPPEQPEPEVKPVEAPEYAEAQPNDQEPSGQARVEQAPKARTAGILAFKNKFASLAKDDIAPTLGVAARYNDADDTSAATTRSMLTSNAPGSSGGINIGSLSRNVGGGGGAGGVGGLNGVEVGQATSSIDAIGGGGDGDRPRARGGLSLSRTDEEIQIVFDRYKASFYRIYNRELRKNPTLRGQMVLRLTIEPNGAVSMCELQSSDMNAPALADQIVGRVKTINFGAKEGVRAVTIVYPIDFLPAA